MKFNWTVIASHYVIVNPTDGDVDAPITVNIRAEDPHGNLVTSHSTDVTLNVSGSASGAGVVDINTGTGSMSISNTVAETIAGHGLADDR